jgi:hypothetical protein
MKVLSRAGVLHLCEHFFDDFADGIFDLSLKRFVQSRLFQDLPHPQ